MIENDSSPSWFAPATADEPSDVAAIQHGGCGSWNGFGRDEPPRELERRAVPLEVLVAPHRADDLDGLGPLGAARFAVDVERGLLHRRRAAGAPLDATLREDVGGRHLLGDPRRVGEPVGQQGHAEAETDVLRRLGERADHDLGRRAVRAALAEVVLDEPRDVEAELSASFIWSSISAYAALLPRPLAVGVRSAVPRSRRSRSRTAGPASRRTPGSVSSHMR